MKYYSLVNPIRVFLILITSLILFHFDFRVMAPTYAHLIAYIITPFILFPLLLKVFPDFFKIKFSLKKELVKKLFKFGIPIMITMLGGLIISYTDTLIITYFRTLEEVALYNVAVPTTKLLWYFSQAIATVIFPMTSELWARGLRGGLAKGLELLLKYSFVLVVPFALILFSFPKIILRILFGESYIGASSALQILAIGAIFYTLYYINNAVISGIGKPQINTKIILVVALFNLVFNIIMVPTYGIVGAAITTSLSFLIALLWNSIVLKRLIKIKVPIVYWLKTLLCGGALLVVIFWLKDLLNLGIWPELIICALLGIGAYIALIYILKLISINEIKGIIRNFL